MVSNLTVVCERRPLNWTMTYISRVSTCYFLKWKAYNIVKQLIVSQKICCYLKLTLYLSFKTNDSRDVLTVVATAPLPSCIAATRFSWIWSMVANRIAWIISIPEHIRSGTVSNIYITLIIKPNLSRSISVSSSTSLRTLWPRIPTHPFTATIIPCRSFWSFRGVKE